MLTTLPPPSRITRAACWVSRNGARTLTANRWSQSSTVVSSSVPRVRQARRVDEPVDAAEVLDHGGDDGEHRIGIGELDRHEQAVELGRDGLAALAVAPADGHLRAQPGRSARDRGAQALRAAGDDDHLPVEHQRSEHGCPSRSDRQAARPMTSGARASCGPTTGGVPAAIALTNASHSRR